MLTRCPTHSPSRSEDCEGAPRATAVLLTSQRERPVGQDARMESGRRNSVVGCDARAAAFWVVVGKRVTHGTAPQGRVVSPDRNGMPCANRTRFRPGNSHKVPVGAVFPDNHWDSDSRAPSRSSQPGGKW
jgi:hypothetical protein